jgi:DNA-damage-inducible protein J
MATTTNINIGVDEELKRKAENIFNEFGLNMSTAMNMFCATLFATVGFLLNTESTSPMRKPYLQ